jgi:hypothetical protein
VALKVPRENPVLPTFKEKMVKMEPKENMEKMV